MKSQHPGGAGSAEHSSDSASPIIDWGGSAYFTGAVVTIDYPRRALAERLPAPLVLETPQDWPGDTHPVVLVFGELANGGIHIASRDWSMGVAYREFGAMLPFVRHPSKRGPAVFVYEMFADDLRSVMPGNVVYGYRKRLGRISADGPRFEVWEQEQRCFSGEGALRGDWARGCSGRTRDWLDETLAGTVVGRRESGRFVASSFEFDFESAQCCGLSGKGDWHHAGGFMKWRSVDDLSCAVRNLRWRTSPAVQL